MEEAIEKYLNNPSPDCEWRDDCQGKKDYDGNILSVSTRYWPSNYQSNKKISAKASIVLNWKPKEDSEEYDPGYLDLISKEFEGDSEAEVKKLVEDWTKTEYQKVCINILLFYKNK